MGLASFNRMRRLAAQKKNRDPLDHDGDGSKGGSLPKTSDKTAAEVLDMAGGNFMTFKSAASKLLGDATPSKKDEIIAALEDLATKP